MRSRYPKAFLFLAIGPMMEGDKLGAIRTDLADLVAQRRAGGDGKSA